MLLKKLLRNRAMKKIVLFIYSSLIFSLCFGQNGAIYQEWYLLSYEIDGQGFGVSQILPHISPNLVIDQNLEYIGYAACNDYLGSFNYDGINDLLIVDIFDSTLNLCDYQTHSDFEIDYFNFFNEGNSFSYTILWDSTGYEEFLELVLAPGFTLFYSNNPLIFSIDDTLFDKLIIYPNPVNEFLKINAKETINSVVISNVLGQVIYSAHVDALGATVDMSGFSKGTYFVKVQVGDDTITKKFIKE